MIRRQVNNEHWLITQDDHARISGALAEKLGRAPFAAPSSDSAILGIAMHDCGWPVHDEAPTLDVRGLPLDVFQSPREIALRVWEESADRAASRDDYAGLLVCLHVMALSVFATETAPISDQKWDLSDTRAKFEMNRFQHRIIELQESLRQRLGMRLDRPLKHGLSDDLRDPKEAALRFDFRWLQAMDRLSLAICCTNAPFHSLEPIHAQPATIATSIRLARSGDDLQIDPWPFRDERIEVQVPFRRLPAQKWNSPQAFLSAYQRAAVEHFTAVVEPLTI